MSTRETPVRSSSLSWPVVARLASIVKGCTAALSILLLANCNFGGDVAQTRIETEAREGAETDFQTDLALASSSVGDTSAEGRADSTSQGGTVRYEVIANGPDSEATSIMHRVDCFEAVNSGQFSLSLNSTFGFLLITDCQNADGSAGLDIDLSVTDGDGTVHALLGASASVGCGDEEVAVENMPEFMVLIEKARHEGNLSLFIQDAFPYGPGDRIRVELVVTASAHLPVDAGEFANLSAEGGLGYSNSTFGVTKVPCEDPCDCEANTDCEGSMICVECVCRDFAVASDPLDLVVSTDQSSIDPGATFSVLVDGAVHSGDSVPYQFFITVDSAALDINGPLVPGFSVGSCNGVHLYVDDGASLHGGEQETVLFFDVNGNGVRDAGDPVVVFLDDPSGDFEVLATLPEDPESIVIPVEAAVSCDLLSLFKGGAEGQYEVSTRIVGYDPDTRGADDGEGAPPPERIVLHDLVIGEGEPRQNCGDPAGAPGITASDSQFILRAAVGLLECALCLCDVAGGGSLVASDALVALRAAVGQLVELSCPPCA